MNITLSSLENTSQLIANTNLPNPQLLGYCLENLHYASILDFLTDSLECLTTETLYLHTVTTDREIENLVSQKERATRIWNNFRAIRDKEEQLGEDASFFVTPAQNRFLGFFGLGENHSVEIRQIKQKIEQIVTSALHLSTQIEEKINESRRNLAQRNATIFQTLATHISSLTPPNSFVYDIYNYFVDLIDRIYRFTRHFFGYFEISYFEIRPNHIQQPVDFETQTGDPGNVNLENRYRELYKLVRDTMPTSMSDGSGQRVEIDEINRVFERIQMFNDQHPSPDEIQFKCKLHELALIFEKMIGNEQQKEELLAGIKNFFVTFLPIIYFGHCQDEFSSTLEKMVFKYSFKEQIQQPDKEKKDLKDHILLHLLVLRRQIFQEIFNELNDHRMDLASTERYFMSLLNEELNLKFSGLVNLEINHEGCAKREIEDKIRDEFNKRYTSSRMVEFLNRQIMDVPYKTQQHHLAFKIVQEWMQQNFNLGPEAITNEECTAIKPEILVRMLQRFEVLS